MLEEFVFRNPVTRTVDENIFRKYLESGKILIYDHKGDDFITCVQLQSILSYIEAKKLTTFENSDGRLGAVYHLLNDFFSLSGTGIMWEKIILLNIVVRSFESQMSVSELLGIDCEDFNYVKGRWNIKIDKLQQKRSKYTFNII
jgi:hypothetical protein